MKLDNIKGGSSACVHGLLTSEQVGGLMAQPVSPSDYYPCVFIFQIHKARLKGKSLFDAISGDWIIREELRKSENPVPTYAVGVIDGNKQNCVSN